ncbi:MAG TPA: hypothetical protein VMW58_04565 [Anaerolineae bacterium]|nr:hypothetical protein [Anaerolineae bacterium]
MTDRTKEELQAWRAMTAVVSMACDDLGDAELGALYRTALRGHDPHGRLFDFEHVKHLFDEIGPDGWPVMHDSTIEALGQVVIMRAGVRGGHKAMETGGEDGNYTRSRRTFYWRPGLGCVLGPTHNLLCPELRPTYYHDLY